MIDMQELLSVALAACACCAPRGSQMRDLLGIGVFKRHGIVTHTGGDT
jgi:hypothetical protein